MNLRDRLLSYTDRLSAVVLALLVAGTTLAFGGAVWWAPTAIAVLTLAFVMTALIRIALEGRMRVLKSPLTSLGLLAIAIGLVQLAPLPPRLAGMLSPKSHDAYALGFFTTRARAADPTLALPEPMPVRSPVSIDRSATLRWVAGAAVCLALFWGVAQYADRLRRLYLVWGSVLLAFSVNTTIVVVQVACHSTGLYGVMEPGQDPTWGPTVNELLSTPNATVLRLAQPPAEGIAGGPSTTPDRPTLIGTMMGGPDAYLALAAIGLPLSLATVLQLVAPRGSRERLPVRLAQSGQGGLVILLSLLSLTAAGLVGVLGGPLVCLPFVFGLILVGLPSAWPSGLRWAGLGMTAVMLLGMGGGVVLRDVLQRIPDSPPPISAESLRLAPRVWADAIPIIRDFPWLGTGMGSFPAIFPSYKTRDEAHTTALSSLLQWCVESGAAGMAVLAIGLLWCLWRLPGAIGRVGTADRPLAFGLIGAASAFSLFSVVHWSVELAAIAIAASALAGACNRWLAGGTDLFVERG